MLILYGGFISGFSGRIPPLAFFSMATPERWKRIKTVFEQVLELPLAERAAILALETKSDPELRLEVQRLLDAEENAATFLEKPFLPQMTSVGQEIGPYRLERLLGRGGMGQVFLASRQDGTFDRKVALKLLRPGFNTEELLRRLHTERQILAQLQHPNIAQMLDGGSTSWGDPYFTMEYVEGLPITQFCDQNHKTLKERLALFKTVCEAVHYAHQNLIVHRDLKPSNILVTADGTVKLLDFGIAKVLAKDGREVLTQTASQVMTPEYAAPEQIRGEAITTAADVYALGILLYELLTGQRPYSLREQALQEVVRIINEAQPSRPSDRVTDPLAIATLPKLGEDKNRLPSQLRRMLRGDLDNMVMMALRKEPVRRYASAEAFYTDIERFLKGEPVSARPNTAGYVIQKFALRHKKGVGIAFAVLLIGIIFAFWHDYRITQERNHALDEAARATAVQNLLVGLFEKADPAQARGLDLSAREILDMGARVADEELAAQPHVKVEVLRVLGEVYSKLGEDTQAEIVLKNANRVLMQSIKAPHTAIARFYATWGEWNQNMGYYAVADSLYRAANTMFRTLHAEEQPEFADLTHKRAYLAHDQGKMAEAEQLYQEALALRKQLYPPQHPKVALSLNDYGGYLMNVGRYVEAKRMMEEALRIRRVVYGEEPHPELAESLYNIGYLHFEMDEPEKAIPYYQRTLAIEEKLYVPDHVEIATTLNNLGGALLLCDRYDEALHALSRALIIQQAELPPEHSNIAVTRRNLGLTYLGQNKLAEAEQQLRLAVASKNNAGTYYLGIDLTLLARIQVQRQQFQEVENHLRTAEKLIRKNLPPDHYRLSEVQTVWAEGANAQGRYAEAEQWAKQAIFAMQKKPKENRNYLADARAALGMALIGQRKFTQAEVVLKQVLAHYQAPDREAPIRKQKAIAALTALYRARG